MPNRWGRRRFLRTTGVAGLATIVAGCSETTSQSEPPESTRRTSSTYESPTIEWRAVYRGENRYRLDVKVQFNDAENLIFSTKNGKLGELSASEADGEWRTIASRFEGDSLVRGGVTIVAATRKDPELVVQSLEKRKTSTESQGQSGESEDGVPTATPEPDFDTPVRTPTQTPFPTETETVVDHHTPTPRPREEYEYLLGLETDFHLDPEKDGRIEREYTAYSEGERTTYTRTFSRAIYEFYFNQSRQYVDNFDYKYGSYVSDMLDKYLMDSIVTNFEKYGENNNQTEREIIEHMMSLVQNLKYTPDKRGTGWNEYPKYPLETLVEREGDCEDTSILMANLLRNYGYGTKLIAATGDMTDGDKGGHMAVGIAGKDDVEGTYYEDEDGTRYYFIETTKSGVPIGEAPSWMNEAYLQPVGVHPVPGAVGAKVTGVSDDQIIVRGETVNTGPISSDAIQIRVTLIDSERYIIDEAISDYKSVAGFDGNIDNLGEEHQAITELTLQARQQEDMRLVAESLVSGSEVSQTESALRSP